MTDHPRKIRWIGVAILAIASALVATAQDLSPDEWLKAGDDHLARRRYTDAADAYRRARESDDADIRVRAGVGATRSLLRAGRYREAVRLAAEVTARDPERAEVMAAEGDALWGSGHFLEAEARYAEALALEPVLPMALHGRGRSLAAQGQMAEALANVASAAAADPTEPLYWLTMGGIYEQQWRYADAVAAYRRSLALLPSRAWDDAARRTRERAEFLSGFGKRGTTIVAGADTVHEIPFSLKNGRPVVRAKVNGWREADFELDTGADAVVLTPGLARSVGMRGVATMRSAGVGTVIGGVRTVQVARIDRFEIGDLQIERVPALVKNPPLLGGPAPETEGFSPLALGLSMRLDYARGVVQIGRSLPEAEFETRLPLRQQRLALVPALVNGVISGSFVVDTGGDVTALSQRLASGIPVDSNIRMVPVRAWGTSGWDESAFLMPYVRFELAPGVGFRNRALTVLDLAAVSALIGVDLGGIVGNDLLRGYRVSIDLDRHELGLSRR